MATVPCDDSGISPKLGFEFNNEYGTFTRWVDQDDMKTYRPDLKKCVSTIIASDDQPNVLGVPFLNNQVVAVDLALGVVFFAERKPY